MTTDTSKSSQCVALLKHFRAGHTITQGEALRLYGMARLASRVHDLRSAFYNIQSQYIEVETRDGSARVKQYWIEE